MTKYILHGGYARRENIDNDNFHKEILKDTGKSVKILLVYFAIGDEKIVANAAEDTAYFEKVREDRKLTFEIADEKIFVEQVKKSDVVYISGGTTLKALEIFKKFENLKDLFEGKVVAGESAGANVLSRYCYSEAADVVVEGLGIVPVKIIPHFVSGLESKLDNLPSELETLLLPDYKHKVCATKDDLKGSILKYEGPFDTASEDWSVLSGDDLV